TSCEQCRMCTDMCPRFLLGHETQPHKMMRVLNYNLQELEVQTTAQLCCQCNLCELFSCPVGLYPKAANNYYRDILVEKGIRYKPTKEIYTPSSAREYRLVPSKRLIARLGLKEFDKQAPMAENSLKPEIVTIFTRQHVGAAAIPTVKVGDYVQQGTVIGKPPENSLGAYIHSSIKGNVVQCETDFIKIRRD
ncbi:MAG: 4Fe-4S dicluster domain-containing protein, partial [Anaerotignaceae bacterium]